jgi:hypothetical protein
MVLSSATGRKRPGLLGRLYSLVFAALVVGHIVARVGVASFGLLEWGFHEGRTLHWHVI